MNSDSFLEILSPAFDDFDLAWAPAEATTCATQAPNLDWLPDEFINVEGFMSDGTEEDEEEEEEDASSEGPPVSTFPFSCTRPASAVNGVILPDAPETYSSVLKLSDIASALHNFSRDARFPCVRRRKPRTPREKSAPEQSAASAKLSSSLQDSACTMRSPVRNVCVVSTPSPMGTSVEQVNAADAAPVNEFKAALIDNVQTGTTESPLAIKIDAFNVQSLDVAEGNEKEACSKLTSDGGSGWDDSDDECDEDDVRGSACYGDSNPCGTHVRIIRRPNSNCGQALTPSPKRLKLDHVKAEVTSSSETANVQDDKDGASSLSRMRKEGMSQREVHILSERQRRKGMRESFSILQSLIPKLKIKHTDRITVLTEVISYIQSLRGTLEELERKKADMMDLFGITSTARTHGHQVDMQGTVTYVKANGSSNSEEEIESRSGGWCNLQNGERVAMVEVTVRMCGPDVFLTLSTPQCRGVWSGVLLLLQRYSIEVSNATLAASGDSSFHCIHAKATNLSRIEGVDLQEKIEGVIIKELRRPARKDWL